MTVFSIIFLIVMGLIACVWHKQTGLERLKAAGSFGGFVLLLVSFALNARRDHAMGDFEFLIDSLEHLIEIRRTLTLLCRYNPNGDTNRQIKINEKLIATYQTALRDLKSHFRVPLPMPRSFH